MISVSKIFAVHAAISGRFKERIGVECASNPSVLATLAADPFSNEVS